MSQGSRLWGCINDIRFGGISFAELLISKGREHVNAHPPSVFGIGIVSPELLQVVVEDGLSEAILHLREVALAEFIFPLRKFHLVLHLVFGVFRLQVKSENGDHCNGGSQ
jgi:hypothetical protein